MSDYLTNPTQFAIVPIPFNANLHSSITNWFYANPEIAPALSRNYAAETQYKSFVDSKAVFPAAKTIAVVINPWARVLRAFHAISALNDQNIQSYNVSSFEAFVTTLPAAYTLDVPQRHWFSARHPQHLWTESTSFDGTVSHVDYIIKVETATQDFAAIQTFFKSPVPLALPTFPEMNYQSYYNDATKALVADYFREDIDRFGYTF